MSDLKKICDYHVKDVTQVKIILNIIYSVLLGLFAKNIIYLHYDPSKEEIINIYFFLDWKNNALYIFAFFLYFILDWFTVNIARWYGSKGINHFSLFLAVVCVFILGSMLVFSINPSCWLLLFFGIYSIIVSWADPAKEYYENEVVINLFFLFRLLFSLILVYFSFLLSLGANEEATGILKWSCLIFVYIIVFVKFIRYCWFIDWQIRHSEREERSQQNDLL